MSTTEQRLKRIAELRQRVMVGPLPEDFLSFPSQSTTQQALVQLDPASQFYSFIPPNTRGRLVIKVVEAKLTKNYGIMKMDPYVRLRVGNAVFETHTSVSGGKTPIWNRLINAYLPIGVESIYVQIFDERSFTQDECVAWAHIILPDGVFGGETVDEWYSLSGPQGEGKEGVINILTSFTAVDNPQPQQVLPAAPEVTDEFINEMADMFPSIEKDVIKTVIESNAGDNERSVNALLELSSS